MTKSVFTGPVYVVRDNIDTGPVKTDFVMQLI